MSKRIWKRTISMLLATVMIGVTAVPARAASSVNYLEQMLYQMDSYNVTEEDVEAFEKQYEEEQGKVIRPLAESRETVAEFAKKKATVMTALYGVNSIQYALIENGKITVTGSAGYAQKETKKEPTAATMYGIGSISKIFTTTAIMQLVERGVISLETPVTEYIPEFEMEDERYKDITVRMLINHSSGLLGGSLNNAILFEDNDTINHDTFLESLKEQRLKANPGDYSVYCNDGFTLAEILVERVTGQTFSEYIAENITKPLGLTRTKTPQDTYTQSKLAGIYDGKTELPVENFNAIGTGGFYSTAKNLCRLAEVFMDGSNKTEVLSGQSVTAMATKAQQGNNWFTLNSEQDGYGLGWDSVNAYPFGQYGIKALVKGGDSVYYHGSLIVLPGEQKAVAVLSSGGSSTVDQIFGSAILLQALYADGSITTLPAVTASYEKPVKQGIPEYIRENAGYYVTMGDILKVEMDLEGTMTLNSLYSDSKVNLIYTGDGKFRDATGTNEFKFVTEGNGKTYLWGGSYASLPGIGTYHGAYYQAQKLEENPLSEEVKAVWGARKGKKYFIIDEKYSAATYLTKGLFSELSFTEELDGYVGYSKIIDKDTALTELTIPRMVGRDLQDYEFYTKNGIEYVKIHDYLAISEDGIKSLSSKSKYKLTVGTEGYAKWYKIGAKTAGKTMKVSVPENGAFAVYDKDGNCKLYSYAADKTIIKLPKGGYVIFAGDAGEKFIVKLSKSK